MIGSVAASAGAVTDVAVAPRARASDAEDASAPPNAMGVAAIASGTSTAPWTTDGQMTLQYCS